MSEERRQYDVIVIGGGAVGCSIAWRLAEAGQDVVLLDSAEIGGGATYAAGGMLAPMAEADEAGHFFQLCVSSRAMYAGFARELREASGLDIEYRTEGTLYLSLTVDDDEELDRRWQWQHAAGMNIKRLEAGCVLKLEPSLNSELRWALKFPDDHQVNNRLLASALATAARRSGVDIRSHTEAFEVRTEPVAGIRRVTGVVTSRGVLHSGSVVLAAGCWSSSLRIDGETIAALKGARPVRGQMMAVEMPSPELKHVVYSRRGYLIPRSAGQMIAGSTTEHAGFDKRITVDGIASIIDHAVEILPGARQLSITEMWAGLRPRSEDGLPILGPDPEISGLIYATGHYRNGILLTPITARAIGELLTSGNSSVDLAPYAVTRFHQRQKES